MIVLIPDLCHLSYFVRFSEGGLRKTINDFNNIYICSLN